MVIYHIISVSAIDLLSINKQLVTAAIGPERNVALITKPNRGYICNALLHICAALLADFL